MNLKVAKLIKRAVIDYLGGDKNEFQRLVEIAMIMNKEICCKECGGELVHCKRKYKLGGIQWINAKDV